MITRLCGKYSALAKYFEVNHAMFPTIVQLFNRQPVADRLSKRKRTFLINILAFQWCHVDCLLVRLLTIVISCSHFSACAYVS